MLENSNELDNNEKNCQGKKEKKLWKNFKEENGPQEGNKVELFRGWI